MSITCPHCHKDDQIQKVSVIYQSGTQDIGGGIGGGGAGVNLATGHVNVGGGYGVISGTQQTILAQKFSPPQPPKPRRLDALDLISFSLPVGPTMMSIVMLHNSEYLNALTGVFMSVIAAFVVKRLFNWRRTNYHRQQSEYQVARSQWDRTYYCYRDATTFVV